MIEYTQQTHLRSLLRLKLSRKAVVEWNGEPGASVPKGSLRPSVPPGLDPRLRHTFCGTPCAT